MADIATGDYRGDLAGWLAPSSNRAAEAGPQTQPSEVAPAEPPAQPGNQQNTADQGLSNLFGSEGQDEGAGTTGEQFQNHEAHSHTDLDTSREAEGDYDFATDPLDARNYVPEEWLDRDYVFDFGSSKYRDGQALERGVQEKDRLIERQKEAEAGYVAQVNELQGRIAELEAERQATQGIMSDGMSQDEVDRVMARNLLPEDLRDIDPDSFYVSAEDSLPDWDIFYSDYSRRAAPKRGEFDDDYDFQAAQIEFEKKAIKAFRKKESEMRSEYQSSRSEREQQRIRWENENAKAIAQVRARRAESVERARSQRAEAERRQTESVAYLKRQLTPENLGITSPEMEEKAGRMLKETVVVAGQEVPLVDAMVWVRSQFGETAAELMIDGVKARLGSSSRSSDQSSSRPRPTARKRMSSMPAGNKTRRRGAPAQAADTSYRDAFENSPFGAFAGR